MIAPTHALSQQYANIVFRSKRFAHKLWQQISPALLHHNPIYTHVSYFGSIISLFQLPLIIKVSFTQLTLVEAVLCELQNLQTSFYIQKTPSILFQNY